MNIVDFQKMVLFFSKFNVLENGYTLLNTLLFSIIGIAVYFFLVYPYLLYKKIKINNYFIYSVFFFVVIGAVIRMFSISQGSLYFLKELSSNPLSIYFYFYYPYLFILLAVSFLVVFEFSILFSKWFNFDFYKLLFYISLSLMLVFVLALLYMSTGLYLFFKLLFLSFFLFILLFLLFKLLKIKIISSKLNSFVFFSQVLDASITSFLTMFYAGSFIEKHFLSNLLLSINPFVFFITKILLSLFIIYLIDSYINDENLNHYFKLFIIIIGYSTALRNLFMIAIL